jgi:hypothetical protein
LRREIHRPFGSLSHKKENWLALLEMYGAKRRRGIKGTGALRGSNPSEKEFGAIVP